MNKPSQNLADPGLAVIEVLSRYCNKSRLRRFGVDSKTVVALSIEYLMSETLKARPTDSRTARDRQGDFEQIRRFGLIQNAAGTSPPNTAEK